MEENGEAIKRSMTNFKQQADAMVRDKIFGDLTEIIHGAGILVFSAYRWAAFRHLNPVFDQNEYIKDREYAFQQIVENTDCNDLSKIINKLIDAQTDIIWHRRVAQGDNGGKSPRDRHEAKRYISYLFFDDLLKFCREGDVCPRTVITESEWGPQVIHLLKSLSIEDYCRINGYLAYLARKSHSPEEYHGYHSNDFLQAMRRLDDSFINCGRTNVQYLPDLHQHLIDDYEKVEKAKINRADTLGDISSNTVNQFMEKFYGYVPSLYGENADEINAGKVLRELYRSGNVRVVNAAEYLLKCCICSLISKDVHITIRQECLKPNYDLPF